MLTRRELIKAYGLGGLAALFTLGISYKEALAIENLCKFDSTGYTATPAPVSSDECSGKLICQNFETPSTGYDHSESWTATPGTGGVITPTDSTSCGGATALRGTQDCLMTKGGSGNPELISPSFSAQNNIYFHALFAFSALPSSTASLLYFRLSSTNIVLLRMSTSGILYIYGASTYGGSHALSVNTPYHLWVTYNKGTGSDAIIKVYYSAISTYSRPATAEAGGTSDALTSQVDNLYFIINQSMSAWWDQILVSSTDTVSTVAA